MKRQHCKPKTTMVSSFMNFETGCPSMVLDFVLLFFISPISVPHIYLTQVLLVYRLFLWAATARILLPVLFSIARFLHADE